MEICAPGSLAIEVYIDKKRCCECATCIEMCSMGVFDMVGDIVMPVRMQARI